MPQEPQNTRPDPAVIAIHGLGGGAHFFYDLAARLEGEHRVTAIDLPTSPPGFSMESWVAGLRPRGSEPVVLLGHSMGTIVALEAWAAWPQQIRGLVFVGGLPEVAPHIRERLSERMRALDGARDLAGWGAKVSPGVFSPATIRDRPEVVTAFEQRFEEQSVDTYVQCCRILLGASAERVVDTVAAPCQAITGAHDQYAPPDAVAAFIGRLPRPTPLAVLPDCGHLPFLEQPDAFAAAVKSFLRTC